MIEGEWLNGVPHGICIIENDKARGVVTYTHGKGHGGPQWIQSKETGQRLSVEYNNDGKSQGIVRNYCND
jgi:hypothetical protein